MIGRLAPLATLLIVASAATGMAARFQEQSSPSSQDSGRPVPEPQPVRVSGDVARTLLLKTVNPEYSKDLRKQRVQGMVTLSVRINKEGDVAGVTLISGHTALGQIAIDAVKQWKYKPYLLKGEAVAVETQVLINFTLAGG